MSEQGIKVVGAGAPASHEPDKPPDFVKMYAKLSTADRRSFTLYLESLLRDQAAQGQVSGSRETVA